MHHTCLFECQLVLTNDLELTRFDNIHAPMLYTDSKISGRDIQCRLTFRSDLALELDSKKRPDIWLTGTEYPTHL